MCRSLGLFLGRFLSPSRAIIACSLNNLPNTQNLRMSRDGKIWVVYMDGSSSHLLLLLAAHRDGKAS